MRHKIRMGLYAAAVLVFLLAGGLLAWLFPREINTFENRYAAAFPTLTCSGYGTGAFQSELEAALADQLPKASAMKKLYQLGTRQVVYGLLSPLSRANPDRYWDFYGISLLDGTHLLYNPLNLDALRPALTDRRTRITRSLAALPQVQGSLYYIEKDTDLNFVTGEKQGVWEVLSQGAPLPMDRFAVDTPEQFYRDFYRTDHHWNHVGSYRAYVALTELLNLGTPLEIQEEVTLPQAFTGSKAFSAGAHQLSEPFSAYTFDFPPMTVTLDGVPAPDYGNQAAVLSGALPPAYGTFYGGDNGEAILEAGIGNRRLLVLGESYDNALLKLLASHCDALFSVDLRYYEPLLGQPFRLGDYVRAHGITDILWIGNADFFTYNDFLWED